MTVTTFDWSDINDTCIFIYLRAKNVSTEGKALATAKNVHLSIILGKNVAPLSTNIKTLFIAMNGYVNIIPTGNLGHRNKI